ncbi:type II toxin-antitoxin system PemK/MazF family toxin [Herbiconiux sp. P16]|uniref:type II toxin-antitoxin system PemK/MazF family toxin n=1 Tax=Herbiconiux wuyangfengii TaxID=3342794 RepID=UPI003CE974CF
MVIRRGSIWWADFGAPRGSAPAHRRPVVILQTDSLNRSALATCVVVAMTSNTAHAGRPGNVFVPAASTELERDSVVNVTQLAAVDQDELLTEVGDLPAYLLEEVERGVRLVLAL